MGAADIVNASPSTRPDPQCSACGTPVRVGTLRSYEHGAFYHVYSRHRQRDREVLESVGRLAPTSDGDRDIEPVAMVADSSTEITRCPVCEQSATVVAEDSTHRWFRVDGCPC